MSDRDFGFHTRKQNAYLSTLKEKENHSCN